MDLINKMNTADGVLPLADEQARAAVSGGLDGVDLTVLHYNEIDKYYDGDPWAWIKARIGQGNYAGIMSGDYIPVSMTHSACGTNVHNMRILGLDPYMYTYGDPTQSVCGHHIDFYARECYGYDDIVWRSTSDNNGTSSQTAPYLNSYLYNTHYDAVFNAFPSTLQAVITEKRMLLETRYSSSGSLEDSTGWSWKNMGKVWAPTEYEVFGSTIWGTKGWSAGMAMQYPLFAQSWKNRILYRYDDDASGDLSRAYWWTASVVGGSSECAVGVDSYGGADWRGTDGEGCAPVCFRIAA